MAKTKVFKRCTICLVLDLEGEGSRQPVLHEEYSNSIIYVISVAHYVFSTGNLQVDLYYANKGFNFQNL